ncbi:MAG: HTH XRE protein [Chaetfec virus UA24_244]|nr:MAG: HTH XRE protein [Chaetfec virus UA24_244]
MSFATRFKEQRERVGLTQVQVADQLGVSKGAVGNYETGVSSPKAEILYKVFEVLDCDANFLFQDEMNNESSFARTKKSPTPAEPEQGKRLQEISEIFEQITDKGQEAIVKYSRYIALDPDYKKYTKIESTKGA